MRLFLFLCLFLFSNLAIAQLYLMGTSVKIVDGDTFDLLTPDQKKYRIRLKDIDCPEKGQDYYQVAKQFLAVQLAGQNIKVVYTQKDRNGRILGDVYIGRNYINLLMVEQGMAWHFIRYSNDPQFAVAEQRARKYRKGLWHMASAQAPWLFRKQKPPR
ncbi:MAG: thermonuclease family protein [Chitinophagaceae bacterium]|nr:thermonuclease family protein [Chitinophagaceae bacterium]